MKKNIYTLSFVIVVIFLSTILSIAPLAFIFAKYDGGGLNQNIGTNMNTSGNGDQTQKRDQNCDASTCDKDQDKYRERDQDQSCDTICLQIKEQDRIRQLDQIKTEAQIINTDNNADLLKHLSIQSKKRTNEEKNYNKYVKNLFKNNLASTSSSSVINFITYGTETTLRLGEGERAGVLYSYQNAYGSLPTTEKEWNNCLKIANGRWPSSTSTNAEQMATERFKEIYKRSINYAKETDMNALMILTYGIRPIQRNINSEMAGIYIFKQIYNKNPDSSLDWDTVRAISYSGAKR